MSNNKLVPYDKKTNPPETPINQRLRAIQQDDDEGEYDEEEFNWGFSEPEHPANYTRISPKERALRGRIGIGAKDSEAGLFQLVSSKQSRDIVRRNNFMPGQFQIWNEKETGGNNKYYGAYEDIDNDRIGEFVVRRGGAEGPLVAVNGYTTKKSDWLA